MPVDLWQPWGGESSDPGTLASFPMLPWCNRITGGGFTHMGQFHAMAPNRPGEPYPIHGDGWLQAWQVVEASATQAVLGLQSRGFMGNPYAYDAEQRFTLMAGGLEQVLSVTHRGSESRPYGLGMHPWFPRTPETRFLADVDGIWLCGANAIPTVHTTRIPPDLDVRDACPAIGARIDHLYTGWSGRAAIRWPNHGLSVQIESATMEGPDGTRGAGYCQVYRPEQGAAFCLEPVSHPVDAFHLPGQPGLIVLATDESLRMTVRWRIRT